MPPPAPRSAPPSPVVLSSVDRDDVEEGAVMDVVASGPPMAPTPPTGDLVLLVLAFLRASGMGGAVDAVEEAARNANVLPSRVAVDGTDRPLSRRALDAAVAALPSDALRHLASRALATARSAGVPALAGATSLAAGGGAALRAALEAEAGAQAPARPPSSKRAPPPSLPARWPPMPRLVSLRATGAAAAARAHATLAPPSRAASSLRHAATVRGHRAAVYCIAVDDDAGRVVTGSDDALVKIWCARTATLLAPCRGHSAEVTDVAVAADGSYYASASCDGTVRVWSADGWPPGAPVAVLRGHAGTATLLAPCPRPDAPFLLLSSGADGTVCVWDARAPGALVARLEPQSGGGGGVGGPSAAAAAPPPPPATRDRSRDRGLGVYHPVPPPPRTRRGDGAAAAAARAALDARAAADRMPTRTALALAAQMEAEAVEESVRAAEARAARGEAASRSRSASPEDRSAPPPPSGPSALLVVAWSPDGSTIAAGAADGRAYAWSWELGAARVDASASARLPRASADGSLAPARAGPPPLLPATAPAPAPAGVLAGHAGAVPLLRFSRAGDAIATGGKDGCARVWRRRRGGGAWACALTLTTDPAEDAAAARDARRRRRDPPPRVVRQVAWAAGDRALLAALGDASVRAWDPRTGALLARLHGHDAPVHVLEPHPTDPWLALTAGYDGRAAVWRVGPPVRGVPTPPAASPLAAFSTRDTAPNGARPWPDAVQVVDGRWVGGGAGFALSDVGGQLHLYDSAPPAPALARARYDQFTAHDYAPLLPDGGGGVVDGEAGVAPHGLVAGDSLVDYLGAPYPESYQTAFRHRRLTSLPLRIARAEAEGAPAPPPGALPRAAGVAPPTLAAAAWAATEAGGDEVAVNAAVQRAEARMAAAAVADAGDEGVGGGGGGARASAPPPPPPRLPRYRGNEDDAADADFEPREEDAGAAARDDASSSDASPSPPAAASSDSDSDSDRPRRGRGAYTGRLRGGASPTRGGRAAKRAAERARGRPSPPKRARRAAAAAATRRLARGSGGGPSSSSSSEEESGESTPRGAGSDASGSERAGGRRGRRAAPGHPPPRPARAYAWLTTTSTLPGVHAPQAGDAVVVLTRGARAWQADPRSPAFDLPPSLRPAEPGTVTRVEYAIAGDGSRATLAVATISLAAGGSLTLPLPPPSAAVADLVVHRARFDTGVARAWVAGDAVAVHWADPSAPDGDGGWWSARVAAAPAGPAYDPPPSVWIDDALWERYAVSWGGAASAGGGSSRGGAGWADSRASPWDVFAPGATLDTARDELPMLDDGLAAAALAAVERAAATPRWAVFADTPPPSQKYPTEGGGSVAYNTLVPLPLSLADVRARLGARFYRSPASLAADFALIAANAAAFNGPASSIAADGAALRDELVAALGLPGDAGGGGAAAAGAPASSVKSESDAGGGSDGSEGGSESGGPPSARGGGRRRAAPRRRSPDSGSDSGPPPGRATGLRVRLRRG